MSPSRGQDPLSEPESPSIYSIIFADLDAETPKDEYSYDIAKAKWRMSFKEEITSEVSKSPQIYSEEGDAEKNPSTQIEDRGLWTPTFLKKKVLGTILAIFISLAVALPALYFTSKNTNGLCDTTQRLRYLWTYGPTAVFTCLAALWSQVDFQSRQTAPWRNALDGPAPASKTVLLDYLSPLDVVVLGRSIRQQDVRVALSAAGTLLISLCVVLSTGLFNIQEFPAQTRVPVTLKQLVNESAEIGLLIPDGKFWSVSYGLQYSNLSYPTGTTRNHAFPDFDFSEATKTLEDEHASVSAEVDVFSWDLTCEEGRALSENGTNLTFYTDSCSFNMQPYSQYWLMSELLYRNGTYEDLTMMDCDQDRNNNSISNQPYLVLYGASLSGNGSNAVAPLKMDGVVDINPSTEAPVEQPDDVKTLLYNLGGVPTNVFFNITLCRPQYNITRGIAVRSGTPGRGNAATSVSIPESAPTWRLENLTEYHVSMLAIKSLGIGGLEAVVSQNRTDDWRGPISEVLRIIGAQIGKEYLMKDANETRQGLLVSTTQRLVIRSVLFKVVEGIIILLTLLMLLFAVLHRSAGATSRDPSSVGGFLTIFSRSLRFQKLVEATQDAGPSKTEERLDEFEFSAKAYEGGAFRIGLHENTRPRPTKSKTTTKTTTTKTMPGKPDDAAWWQPLSLRLPSKMGVVALPIIVAVTLEGLLRRSRASDGIASVAGRENGEASIKYAWVLVPALVMASIQAMVAGSAFSLKLFQPYHALRAGSAPAESSLLNNFVGKLTVVCLWSSLRKRQPAVAAVSMAMLLAPFLTIAASSLYIVEEMERSTPVVVTQKDAWFLDKNDRLSYLDPSVQKSLIKFASPESMIPGMVLELNMSFPSWTYEQFSFPTVSLPSYDSSSAPSPPSQGSSGNRTKTSLLEVTLPALRAVMNCSIVSNEDFTVKQSSAEENYEKVTIDLPSNVDPKCKGISGDEYVIQTYFAGPSFLDDVGFESSEHYECPWMYFVLGRLPTVHLLSCSPYIERVDVKTTFQLPSFAVDGSRPPTPVPGTAAPILGFRSMNDFLGGTDRENLLVDYLRDYLDPARPPPRPWTGMMTRGVGAVPVQELTAPDGAPKFLAGVERIFGIRFAQQLRNFALSDRAADNTLPQQVPAQIPAVLIDPRHSRLVQDERSTRVLQALLVAVSALCGVAFLALDTRRVLPANPCSIAAMAKLLARSSLLARGRIPAGAEWWGDEKLGREVLDGVFSMGWWDGSAKEGGRFGIDEGSHPAGGIERA